MNKRNFIKTSLFGSISMMLFSNKIFSNSAKHDFENLIFDGDLQKLLQEKNIFELPKLPYEKNALEPYIDAQTMEIHHTKHHAAYVKNLNDEIAKMKLENITLIELLQKTSSKNIVIRNNAGGHFNHSLFWKLLQPNAKENEELALHKAIVTQWGNLENFKTEFNKTALSRFGSGWAWLCKNTDGKLFICSTANQDNPLMKKIVKTFGKPILALDVWEHAYYLKYQNKRKDYIENYWKLLNWEFANSLYI
jgi:Fe-Mn family superoxide dismutase